MSLSLDQVRKVAALARLDLADADLEPMRAQLSAILDYVDQLQQLDTEGVEPLAHPLRNVFRADDPAPSLPADAALANAPARSGDFFAVPAVFDTDDPAGH
jgi:aspartyl-tRNA(Asn)/glutamyl-tRNA(Gln) amidotransferase subunit C